MLCLLQAALMVEFQKKNFWFDIANPKNIFPTLQVGVVRFSSLSVFPSSPSPPPLLLLLLSQMRLATTRAPSMPQMRLTFVHYWR